MVDWNPLPEGWTIDPPGDWTGNNDESRNRAEEILAEKWNGEGRPPSREVAAAWAIQKGGLNRSWVESYITNGSGSLTSVGDRIRKVRGVKERTAERKGEAAAAGDKPEDAAAADANQDGKITVDELDTNSDDEITEDELLASFGDPGAVEEDTRGEPLWPYAGGGTEGLTVKDQSKAVPTSQERNDPREDNPRNTNFGGQIGARYYEKDALQPLRWSPERVAELQRTMQEIGLYGDKKVRLGSWGAADQDALAAVMADSNTKGLTWQETLVRWKREPPVDLIESIKGEQPSQPTIRVTNPLDIRQASEAVSQSLTGAVDRQFAQGMVGGYQGAEIGAQQAVITDQDMGGGGVEADAPSVQAYAENQLRLQKPLEVDGYQFMSQFETFLDMLGAR